MGQMRYAGKLRTCLVVVLAVLAASGLIGYAVWSGLGSMDASLKEDADHLTSEDAGVRETAHKDLVSAGIRSITPLLRAIKLGDLNLRIAAIDVLQEVGAAQQDVLVDANIEKVVKTVAEAVAKLGPDGGFVIASRSHPLRLSVAKALGEYPSEASVELLLALLKEKEEDIRQAARDSLVKAGARGSRVLARELGGKARSEDALLEGAVQALVQDMVKDLLDRSAYDDVRMRAARVLKDLGGERIENAEGMSALLVDTGEPLRLRKAAAELLPDVAAARLKPCVEKLKTALEDKNGSIQLGAAVALAKVGEEKGLGFVMDCLKNDDTMVRLSAAEALDQLGAQAKQGILDNLNSSDAAVRAPLLRVLLTTDQADAPGRCTTALGDLDGDVRTAAEIGLGQLNDARALRPLLLRLDDRRERVKHYASWAVEMIGAPARPFLNATLDSLSPYDFKNLVALIEDAVRNALRRRGIAARVAAVGEAIRSELTDRRMNYPTPWAVRVEATAKDGKSLPPVLVDVREVFVFLATLSRMTGVSEGQLMALGHDVVESLAAQGIRFKRYGEMPPEALKVPDNVIPLRYSSFSRVAAILGVIGDRDSVGPLLKALRSDDLDLESQAAWAMGMVADRCKGDLPQKAEVVDRLIYLALNSNADTNAATAVKNANMMVREKSAEALGRIADPKAKAALQTVLVLDEKIRVRTAASIAIGRIDGTERRLLLDQYAQTLRHEDPKTRAGAVKRLGELGSFDAREVLLQIIHGKEEHGIVLDAAEDALKAMTGRDYSREVTAKRIDAPAPPADTGAKPQETPDAKAAKPADPETKPEKLLPPEPKRASDPAPLPPAAPDKAKDGAPGKDAKGAPPAEQKKPQ